MLNKAQLIEMCSCRLDSYVFDHGGKMRENAKREKPSRQKKFKNFQKF